MDPTPPATSADECFRCGYNLFGIADDQACPECGLLAIRSRRVTDELHETRPRWLRSIFWGLCLILSSIALAFFWPWLLPYIIYVLYSDHRMSQGGLFDTYDALVLFGPSAILLAIGVIRLTAREGYAPADRADRKRRWALLIAALMPLVILVAAYHTPFFYQLVVYGYYDSLGQLLTAEALVLILSPLPPLLFLQLRSLAKRACFKYLPHDCIVVGFAVPILVMCWVAYNFIADNPQDFGVTLRRSLIIWSLTSLLLGILAVGFVFWTLYLLINFASAFRTAATEARWKWIRDDLSLSHSEMPK